MPVELAWVLLKAVPGTGTRMHIVYMGDNPREQTERAKKNDTGKGKEPSGDGLLSWSPQPEIGALPIGTLLGGMYLRIPPPRDGRLRPLFTNSFSSRALHCGGCRGGINHPRRI